MLDSRCKFVAAYLDHELPMAALCRSFGISRTTGYHLVHRYFQEGPEGLGSQSRAPRHHPQAVAEEIEEDLVACRAQHATWGPRKLRAALVRREPERPWPAPSTIGELLHRRGLTVPRRRPRGTAPAPTGLTDPNGPNEVWAADFKGHFALEAGPRCHPLTISDGASRMLLRCQALPREGGEVVKPVFAAAFAEYGLPRILRTDNGAPFASTGPTGLTRLSAWWIKLGLTPERIAPGHPEQNGRHERMHRTLKKETTQPPQRNLRAQQRAFDRFRQEYNYERPHEALGQKVPAELYSRSPREYPVRLPEVAYPADLVVRRVRNKGHIRWHGQLLFVSEALCGEPVGLEPQDERYWALYYNHLPLLILDDYTGAWLPALAAAQRLRALREPSEP
jgi:transposase InsO family protein